MRLLRNILILNLILIFGCAASRNTTSSSSKRIEEKYAGILGVSEEAVSNKKLYSFIDEWYGVPYMYGGDTKKGIDCSGFTGILFKEVYGKDLIGTAWSIYNGCKHISREELQEGDLVFFKINSKKVSHIGVYLQNNKFISVTTKGGIMIDDLNEEYYNKYFFAAGRIK